MLNKNAKWTAVDEKYLIEVHNNVVKNGGIKELEFKKLESILGRSASSIGRKYYKMFPARQEKEIVDVVKVDVAKKEKKASVVNIQHKKQKITPSYLEDVKFNKIIWTKERVDILKDELHKKIKNGYSSSIMANNLSQRLNMGFSTVHLKLSRLKQKLNASNIVDLYNALLVEGKNLQLLNDDSMVKKYKKSKKKNQATKNIEIHSEIEENKVIVDNVKKESVKLENKSTPKTLSFWQKINPFARIKRLEKELGELQDKLKNQ